LVAEELLKSVDKPLRSQLQGRLCALLSIDDWNAVWQKANHALEIQWVQFIEATKVA
jgi:hypothetical protein